MRDINRRNWSRFVRDVTRLNQFGRTRIELAEPDGTRRVLCAGAPFWGLELVRRGRRIEAVRIQVGRPDPAAPAATVAELELPARIAKEISTNGRDEVIQIENLRGELLTMTVAPHTKRESYEALISGMAYSLSQGRQFAPGHELDDWFRAEQIVRQAALGAER